MQAVLDDFTVVMTWLIMLGNSVVIVLLGVAVLRLRQHRQRALAGTGGMVLILVATGLGLLFLASYAQEQHTTLSRMVLPLTASILIASLYALSFPPVSAFPPDRSIRGRRLLLILTTLGVLVGAISLVLLDLFSH